MRARLFHFNSVVLSDAQEVITVINREEDWKNVPVIQDIPSVLNDFVDVSFNYISRILNGAAHLPPKFCYGCDNDFV